MIPVQKVLVRYTVTAGVLEYAVPFALYGTGDVNVYWAAAGDTETQTKLAPGTDYSVTVFRDMTGGKVTLADGKVPAGATLAIESAVPLTQELDLSNTATVDTEATEGQLDRMVQMIQQFSEQAGRAVKVPVTSDKTPEQYMSEFWEAVKNVLAAIWEMGKNIGNSTYVTATGSDTPRTLADRFGDVVNVRDFGAVGDGVTDDTDAILRMISVHGYARFLNGTYLCNGKFDAPMHFAAGASLYAEGGARVTITGPIESSRQHIFRGDGIYELKNDVDSGENARMVHVSWFGASPSPLATKNVDQTAAIQRAFDAVGNTRESVVEFDIGNYTVNGTLSVGRATWVKGAGSRRTVFHTDADNVVFKTLDTACRFSGIQHETTIENRENSFIQLNHDMCEVYDIFSFPSKNIIEVNAPRCKIRNVGFVSGVNFGESCIRIAASSCTVQDVYCLTSSTKGPDSVVLVDSSGGNITDVFIDNVESVMASNLVMLLAESNSISKIMLQNLRYAGFVNEPSPYAPVLIRNSGTGTIKSVMIDKVISSDNLTKHVVAVENVGTGGVRDIHISGVCGGGTVAGVKLFRQSGTMGHITIADDVDVSSSKGEEYSISSGITDLDMSGFAQKNTRPTITYDYNIDDDDFIKIELGRNVFTGFIIVTSGYKDYGMFIIRALSSSQACTPVSNSQNVEASNMILSGTTGADGKITVSCNKTNIYIENRIGSLQRVSCTLMAGAETVAGTSSVYTPGVV